MKKQYILILLIIIIIALILNIIISNKAVDTCINNGQKVNICNELYTN